MAFITGNSGFPKATNIGTQIDKAAGAERKVVGKYVPPEQSEWNLRQSDDENIDAAPGSFTASGRRTLDITAPATELAQVWDGHRYGLQALKPAVEPIIVFQKKYEGRPLDNITETGAGALNIEATRIGINSNIDDPRLGGNGDWSSDKAAKNIYDGGYSGKRIKSSPSGRWPSNLIVEHAPECRKVGVERGDGYTINRWTDGAKPFGGGAGHEFDGEDVAETVEIWECVDGCPAKTINAQSGNNTGGKAPVLGHEQSRTGQNGVYGIYDRVPSVFYGDRGGASRFFFNFQAENLEGGDPVFYCSKASRKERDAGLERFGGREIKTMNNRVCLSCGKSELDGRRNEICCDNPTYESGQVRDVKNPHVAVKPLRLTEYLAKMLLPPDAYKPRRILVPFSGSGSEAIGARLAGWDEVVGVELSTEFVEIAKARAAFWLPEHKAKQLRLE